MAIFNSYVTNYRRVSLVHIPAASHLFALARHRLAQLEDLVLLGEVKPLATSSWGWTESTATIRKHLEWLVVWNMVYFPIYIYIYIYVGNNHPSWLIFFRGIETTNQSWIVGPHDVQTQQENLDSGKWTLHAAWSQEEVRLHRAISCEDRGRATFFW